MASEDKLWFEMGVRDHVTKELDKILKKVNDIQRAMGMLSEDNKDLGFKASYDNIKKLEVAIAKINNALTTLRSTRASIVDPNDIKEINRMQLALGKLRTRIGKFMDEMKGNRDAQATKGLADAFLSSVGFDAAIAQVSSKTRQYRVANDMAAQSARNLGDANRRLMQTYDDLTSAEQKTNRITETLQRQMASYFSLYGIEHLLKNVITIGGQFEYQHIALQNILGDLQQANTLFSQLQDLAIESPKTFMELTSYAKQLSAYQIPYNELFDTTKRLADLSTGLGVDMSRLILAYGQVRSAAVLRGQELRQFTEAGIPLVQKLADEFAKLNGRAVTTGEVFELISKRAVPFEMVKKILWDMTSEGGQFFNMQAELADTLYGKWQKLQDQWQITLGHIAEGESLSGRFLKATLEGLVKIVSLFDTLMPALALFGLGRASRSVFGGITRAYGNISENAAISNMQKAKLETIARLERERILYGKQLTQEEQRLVNTKGKLVSQDYMLLAAEGKISERKAYQLMQEGKLQKTMFRRLLDMRGYTKEQQKQIMNGNVQILQGNTGGWDSLKKGVMGFFGGGVGAAMTGIGVIMSLYSNAASKAEEAREAATGATDEMLTSLKNVNDIYADLTQNSPKGIDEINSAINRMTNALKESGGFTAELQQKLDSTSDVSEKYAILYDAVQKVSAAYLVAKENVEAFLEAANRVGSGNFFTKIFNDPMLLDLQELSQANVEKRVAKAQINKISAGLKDTLKMILQDVNQWSEEEFGNLNWEELLGRLPQMVQRKMVNRLRMLSYADYEGKGTYWEKMANNLEDYLDALDNAAAKEKEVDSQMEQSVEYWHIALEDRASMAQLNIDDITQWKDEDLRKFNGWINDIVGNLHLEGEAADKVRNEILKSFPPEVTVRINALPALDQSQLAPWQDEIDKYFKKNEINIPIDAQTSMEKVEKDLKNERERLQEQMDRSGGILLSVGLDLSKLPSSFEEIRNLIPFWKQSFTQKAFEDYAEGKTGVQKIDDAGKELGIKTLKKEPKPTNTRKTDEELKAWRERKKALDEYYKLYKEYSQYMSREEAISRINATGLIAGQALPANIDDYLAVMKEFMDGISGKIKGTERQTFWDGLVGDYNRKDFEEGAKRNAEALLHQLEEELKTQGKQWDLYKKILEATGSRDSAAQIAFGGAVDFRNFAEELRSRLEREIASLPADSQRPIDTLLGMDDKQLSELGIHAASAIRPLLQQLKDAQQQLKSEDVERLLDAMKKMSGVEEQIAVAEMKLADARRQYGDNSVQALALEKEIGELRAKQLEDSTEYLRFYSAIMSMTITEAESAGAAIKENLVRQLADGTINADKYLKSIKNVDAQLEKIRQKNTYAKALSSGGILGWIGAHESNQEDVVASKAIAVQEAEKEVLRARKEGDHEHLLAAQSALIIARDELEAAQSQLRVWKEMRQQMNDITSSTVYQVIVGMSHSIQTFKQETASIGEDLEMDAWVDDLTAAIGGIDDGLKTIMSGDLFGGLVKTFTGPITAISKNHDARIDRKLQKSQRRVKALTDEYNRLEQAMQSALGGIYTTGGYDEMFENLQRRRDELQLQYDLESDKKDSSADKLHDLQNELNELDQQIQQFALDMAKTLYDIDLQQWASSFGDALFQAWQKGEDGAEAFKKKTEELLADLTKNILVKKVIETALKPMEEIIESEMLRTKGQLDENSIAAIAARMAQIGQTLPTAVNTLLDAAEQGVQQSGYTLKSDDSSSSSSKSLGKALTEQETSLWSSYLNAIRADVAVIRSLEGIYLPQLLASVQASEEMPVIARSQLLSLDQIAANTLRSANAAETISEYLRLNLLNANKFHVS